MTSNFKDQHSTVMCIGAVKKIAGHYNEKGSNAYVGLYIKRFRGS